MLLKEAVPWGRSASEYLAMFGLTAQQMRGRILDCAGGPSSFTSELNQRGNQVVSCDPLYQFSTEEIRQRIDETYPRMIALNEANRDNFCWEEFGSPVQLGKSRMYAMNLFLDDFLEGKEQGRYITGALPQLPFPPDSFDLALCSHFLFTYSEQFTAEFHFDAILEMARIAAEVRVFPILTAFTGALSPHLQPVMDQFSSLGYKVEVRQVAYEFQKGGNRMLIVRHPE